MYIGHCRRPIRFGGGKDELCYLLWEWSWLQASSRSQKCFQIIDARGVVEDRDFCVLTTNCEPQVEWRKPSLQSITLPIIIAAVSMRAKRALELVRP